MCRLCEVQHWGMCNIRTAWAPPQQEVMTTSFPVLLEPAGEAEAAEADPLRMNDPWSGQRLPRSSHETTMWDNIWDRWRATTASPRSGRSGGLSAEARSGQTPYGPQRRGRTGRPSSEPPERRVADNDELSRSSSVDVTAPATPVNPFGSTIGIAAIHRALGMRAEGDATPVAGFSTPMVIQPMSYQGPPVPTRGPEHRDGAPLLTDEMLNTLFTSCHLSNQSHADSKA